MHEHTDNLEARLRGIGTAPTTPPRPVGDGEYALLKGTSLDGTTDYLVHLWTGAGAAELASRPAGSTDRWVPVAHDMTVEVIR